MPSESGAKCAALRMPRLRLEEIPKISGDTANYLRALRFDVAGLQIISPPAAGSGARHNLIEKWKQRPGTIAAFCHARPKLVEAGRLRDALKALRPAMCRNLVHPMLKPRWTRSGALIYPPQLIPTWTSFPGRPHRVRPWSSVA